MAPKCQVRWSELMIHTLPVCAKFTTEINRVRQSFTVGLPNATWNRVPDLPVCSHLHLEGQHTITRRHQKALNASLQVSGWALQWAWGGMGIASTNENDKALVEDKFSVRPRPCTVSRKSAHAKCRPYWSISIIRLEVLIREFLTDWRNLKNLKVFSSLLLQRTPHASLVANPAFVSRWFGEFLRPTFLVTRPASSGNAWQCHVDTCYMYLHVTPFFSFLPSSDYSSPPV